MIELLRSNDLVLISFVTSLLEDAEIRHAVADGHMSAIDGGIGALPRRIMVAEDRHEEAQRLLVEAGISG